MLSLIEYVYNHNLDWSRGLNLQPDKVLPFANGCTQQNSTKTVISDLIDKRNMREEYAKYFTQLGPNGVKYFVTLCIFFGSLKSVETRTIAERELEHLQPGGTYTLGKCF